MLPSDKTNHCYLKMNEKKNFFFNIVLNDFDFLSRNIWLNFMIENIVNAAKFYIHHKTVNKI